MHNRVATSECLPHSEAFDAANQQGCSHSLEEALLQGARGRTFKTVLRVLRMLRKTLTQ